MSVKSVTDRAIGSMAILSAFVLGLGLWADAQPRPGALEGAPPTKPGMERQKEQSAPLGSMHPMELSATLADPGKNAQQQTATVEVKVAGVQLIDPAAVKEQPQQGQGHLHYRVDDGPVVATTATKLSFHDLSSGEHRITVMLVGNNHQPLGPQKTLAVTIPKGELDRAERR